MTHQSLAARRSRQPPELAPRRGQKRGRRLAFFLGIAPGSGGGLRPLSYIGSAAAVALALGCGLLIRHYIGVQSILLVFLMPVLASAIVWGVLPSLFACLLSVAAFNFFLIPPLYTFTIADPDNAVALSVYFVVAVSVSNLAAVLGESRVFAEAERLRAALLTSISHDLRTPLASILGAVSSLRSFPENYDPKQREELLATIQEEAERLNRFVANLLDMTRLESGAIELRLDLFDVAEVVGAALRRAADVLAQHQILVDPGRSSDAADRCRPVRAGAVQPPRQRRKVFAAGRPDRAARLPRRGRGHHRAVRRGAGHPVGR
jgi:K+-sensing histidine kinase KdpD